MNAFLPELAYNAWCNAQPERESRRGPFPRFKQLPPSERLAWEYVTKTILRINRNDSFPG